MSPPACPMSQCPNAGSFRAYCSWVWQGQGCPGSSYSLPCFSLSMWWHNFSAGPSFRPMYFMIMSLRSSIRAFPSISWGNKEWDSIYFLSFFSLTRNARAPNISTHGTVNLHVFWIVQHVGLTLWGQHPSQTASPLQWTRRRGFYWAATHSPAQTPAPQGLWWSWLLPKQNTHIEQGRQKHLYTCTVTSTDSYGTFDPSERLCGAELCWVGGEAAHGCARVVQAAGLSVVLWGAAYCLGPRGHGVGGWVHVALLLY